MATGRVPTTANSPLTAKGDLFTYSTAPARLAVGNDGETIVADSAATTGLRYQGNYAAGKNEIINGDFSIWQRGTSFSNPAAGTFLADRYYVDYDGTGGTTTISQQTTPTVIATGVNTSTFLRWANTVAGTGQSYNVISQKIENVATFAEQTVTFSFYAKASASTALSQIYLNQNFGSGGSSQIFYNAGSATLTTSWARYSFTVALGSLSGKTVGTGSFLRAFIGAPLNATFTIDTYGWQVEAGSVATAFQTATGTIQGELAACQRYFQILGGDVFNEYFGIGAALTTTDSNTVIPTKVTMRGTPTTTFTTASNYRVIQGVTSTNCSAVTGDVLTKNTLAIQFSVASGLTVGNATRLLANNTSATISISAEL
jgi:hypothetical protein